MGVIFYDVTRSSHDPKCIFLLVFVHGGGNFISLMHSLPVSRDCCSMRRSISNHTAHHLHSCLLLAKTPRGEKQMDHFVHSIQSLSILFWCSNLGGKSGVTNGRGVSHLYLLQKQLKLSNFGLFPKNIVLFSVIYELTNLFFTINCDFDNIKFFTYC